MFSGHSQVKKKCTSFTLMKTICYTDLAAHLPFRRQDLVSKSIFSKECVRLPWDNSQAQRPVMLSGKCEVTALKGCSSVEELLARVYLLDLVLSTA